MQQALPGSGQVELYEQSYTTDLVLQPEIRNATDKQIQAFSGQFLVTLTDVLGATARGQLNYDWKEPLASGAVLSSGGDVFSDRSGWYPLNSYLDDDRLFLSNIGRDDANVTVEWIPETIVFSDGSSIGKPGVVTD